MRHLRCLLPLGMVVLTLLCLLLLPKIPLAFTVQDTLDVKQLSAVRDLKVAVVEQTAYHEEVIGSVLQVLHDLDANFTLYRERWYGGFQKILEDVYPHKLQSYQQLEASLKKGEVDVMVMVTCDSMFWNGRQSIIKAANGSSHTQIICIPHEIEKLGNGPADKTLLLPFVEQKRLTMMPLSEHSRDRMRGKLQGWAKEAQKLETNIQTDESEKEVALKVPDALESKQGTWADVKITDFAPVFKIPASVRTDNIEHSKIPSDVAILGRMLPTARRYDEILRDLSKSVQADPAIWGYKFDPKNPEILIPTAKKPFHLHLIGKPYMDYKLNIPHILVNGSKEEHNIVQMRQDSGYSDFYNLIGSMDLILPAFKNRLYLDHRASASIPATVISRTKVLATYEVVQAYPYLSPTATTLYRKMFSEIDAIKLLRGGVNPWTQQPYSTSEDEDCVPEKGLSTDFSGSCLGGGNETERWELYETEIGRENMRVWAGVLAELGRRSNRLKA